VEVKKTESGGRVCPSARVVGRSSRVKAIGDIATTVGRRKNTRWDTETESGLLQDYFVSFQFYLELGITPTHRIYDGLR